MKIKLLLLSIFLFSGNAFAQSGNSYKSKKIVKQQPKTNAKARSHANSNSVFGTGNIHPKYIKKSPPKKEEIVKEKIKEEGELKKTKTKEKK